MTQLLQHDSPATSVARPTTPSWIQAYWEGKALRYNCLHDRLAVVLAELRDLNPPRLLDVGCSTAALAKALDAALPGTAYYGCDISQAAVSAIGRTGVVVWDLNDGRLPFPDTSFNVVVASGICEYIADLPTFFARVAERLADGGHFIVSYINQDHVSRRWRRLRGRSANGDATWQPIRGLSAFVENLRAAGFAPVRQIATNGRIRPSTRPLGSTRRRQRFAHPPWVNWAAPQVVFVCTKDRCYA
ncbi:MAG: class I SAM-dependent methyltransferase [Pirellulales bacterium]|nr:class I SAM-dependent methyltransferase [Planctomycetales bacterium]